MSGLIDKIDGLISQIDVSFTSFDSCPIAVITGVSSGIGLAVVEELISKNWLVFGCARRQNKIDELNKKYPSKDVVNAPYFSVVDATDINGIKKWSEMIINNYGSPTILFANAGIAQSPSLIEDTDPDLFNTIITVNIRGPFALFRAFLPAMKKVNRNSIIIGMSSGVGKTGVGSMATYSTSKWGLEGFMSSLSKELNGLNICAFSYDPGVIGTDGFGYVNNMDKNKLENIGMPTAKDFANEFYPQMMQILQNPKEYNGKQIMTPIMTKEKYKSKVESGFNALQFDDPTE